MCQQDMTLGKPCGPQCSFLCNRRKKSQIIYRRQAEVSEGALSDLQSPICTNISTCPQEDIRIALKKTGAKKMEHTKQGSHNWY